MSLEGISRFDYRCLTEYFLHRLGYSYDGQGNINAVTEAEKYRLWQGLSLWYEHVENYDRDHSPSGMSGSARQAGKLDADTRRKWQRFSQRADEGV